jgi:hypothetical protein
MGAPGVVHRRQSIVGKFCARGDEGTFLTRATLTAGDPGGS